MPSTPIRVIIGIIGGGFIGGACWQAFATSIPLGWLAIPAGAIVGGLVGAYVKADFWNNTGS